MFHDHSLVEAVKLENPEVHAFFRLLALCHTVMAEEKKEGELFYQAQSPDEGALVTAARNFGFVFRSRTPDSVSIVEMGEQHSYELLAILDFNNVRKRMSVIVRGPEGKLSLYCKGADTIIYERLHQSCSKLMDVTTEHLNEFAGEGLRTLALAYKDLDEEYFNQWKQRHHEASVALDDREGKLDDLYEEIEKDLLLLGATAIEDKLQDGVPQTIEQLAKADIKIWVLTGDKQETAENIGYSCNLLREEMNDVFIVSGNSPEDVRQELRDAQTSMTPAEDSTFLPERAVGKGGKVITEELVNGEYGLVVNGHSLAYALERSMELEFLRTACMCKAVICCRVTPLQKAQVVELVKKYKQAVTLAIGDGANDVSMIKAAHIGVGISGQEGMQAVLSSDYSFAQFRFLQRLLLVHGRWSYLRMCKFLRYFFYKNFTFTFVHFWYAFFCGFSAQTVYDEWFITLYNLVYTALPVLGMSLFDQDVNDIWSFQHPQLYVPGQLNLYFSKKAFFKCALHSCYSSLVLFFIPYAAMQDTVRDDGKDVADYQSFALLTQTCLLFAVTIQLGLEMSYWTAVNTFFVLGSLAMYFAVTFTMYSNGMFLMLPSAFPFIGTARNSLNQPNIWLTILLTSILCVLPVVTYRFLFIQLYPTINDKVQMEQLHTYTLLYTQRCSCSCEFPRCDCLPKLSGDVQGETGQGDACPSASTRPHAPHQLPALRLRLLACTGLRGPGDVGTVPAASCCVPILRFCPHWSAYHGVQSHGTIGWIQPDRTPSKRQGPRCGGDIAADVQDYQRSCTLTDSWLMSGRRTNANWTAVCRRWLKAPIRTFMYTLKNLFWLSRKLHVTDSSLICTVARDEI
ncbi:hypothetical protein ABVT39_027738 [Epinephelus coioides]